jgi:hypothetical protein
MNVAVWDTYVDRHDGRTMHFDILVKTDTSFETVRQYGAEYLSDKDVIDDTLTTDECDFCHVEAASEETERAIDESGYAIVELNNCD